MSSPKPASTPGWQLCPPCPQEPCREHPRAPLRGHCVSLGLVTDGVTPTCAVPLLPRRQASLKNILPPFPSLQTAQWRWNHSALCVPMFFFFPNETLGGVSELSLQWVHSCFEDILPRFLPPPGLPLLGFPLLLCTSYLRCQESSLTEFIVAILIKLIFLSARPLGSEAAVRFIDFHLEGKVSSFHSHEAIWKIYDRSRRTLARGNDIPVQLKHFQVSFFPPPFCFHSS